MARFVVKDCYNEKVHGRSLVCDMGGLELEINSYEDKAFGMFDNIAMLKWSGLRVPTLPLAHAKRFYGMIGRKEKVEIITRHLAGYGDLCEAAGTVSKQGGVR